MNIALYDQMADRIPLCQNRGEWRGYLEFVEAYFRNRSIDRPVIVELGVENGGQKIYYDAFLPGAEHIGIDFDATYAKPDIQGDAFTPETMAALKERLGGRGIDLLFIDLDTRDTVPRCYELYEPLTTGLVVLHNSDVETSVAWKFWRKLRDTADGQLKVEFVSRFPAGHRWHITPMGIGVIVKGDA